MWLAFPIDWRRGYCKTSMAWYGIALHLVSALNKVYI
jgi:hypothetical protein